MAKKFIPSYLKKKRLVEKILYLYIFSDNRVLEKQFLRVFFSPFILISLTFNTPKKLR